MKKRANWGSRLGFILAAAGSAIGLANIWRFPYMVGSSGGAVFVLIYIFCLALIGFPVFICELLIGRSSQANASRSFQRLTGEGVWPKVGKCTILTGFIVSGFYSAVAGIILGYLFEALKGNLSLLANVESTAHFHSQLVLNPYWTVGFHALFMALSTGILISGVRSGIERASKIFMPLLFLILLVLTIKGLTLDGAMDGVRFLFSPDWSELTPMVFLLALGQSFFTLSLGQGTMITYGSYLHKGENLFTTALPVVLMDTCVSLIAAVAVFSIVFAAGMHPDGGPSLIFTTLPIVFSQLPGGDFFAVGFFLLVVIAALTSEISAMEPSIAYLQEEWGWSRHKATLMVALAVFSIGIPCTLSFNLLSGWSIFNMNILDLMNFTATSILIPIGGLLAVLYVGWYWGYTKAIVQIKTGAEQFFERFPFLEGYFKFSIKYIAPVLIGLVFLNSLGVF